MKILHILIVSSVLCGFANGSKILVLTPFGSTSVRAMFGYVCEGLLARGHEITFISSDEPYPKHENLTHLNSPHTALDQLDLFTVRMGVSVFRIWKKAFPEAAKELYKDEKVMEVWRNRHQFDAIIINSAANEMAFPFLLDTKAPFITLQPAGIDPLQLAYLGNWVSPATMPSIILPYDNHMTFFERLVNTVTLLVMKYSFRRSVGIPLAEALEPFFPNLPDPRTVYPLQTLALFNSHFLIDSPVPLLPNQVEVGCLSCRAPKPIEDKETADFLKSASKDGAVFFSLGSFQQLERIPESYVAVVIEAFRRLPRYKFVAHIAVKDTDSLPSNVRIASWYPQQDILAHPSTRLFISHCGRQSVNQALYHGVPILGVPIAFDQPRHCNRLKRRGEAVVLEWETLTPEVLADNIQLMMNTSKYYDRVQRVAERFSAQKETGMDKAVWHIEYAISQGDDLLRYSGQQLSLVQYLLLDVMAVLLAIAVVIGGIIFLFLRTIFRFCGKNTKEKLL